MREIEFRFWDKRLKKFVPSNMYSVSGDGKILFSDGHDCSEEIEALQYIGYKDKNEKKIHEGDIILIANYGPYEVRWFEYLEWDGGGSCAVGFYLAMPYLDDGELDYHIKLAIAPEYLEVVGNKYEGVI